MKQQVDVEFLSTNDVFQKIVRNALTLQLEHGIKQAEQSVDNSATKTVFFTHNYAEEFSSIIRQVKQTFDVAGLDADKEKAKEKIYDAADAVVNDIILELKNKYPITDSVVANSSISCTVFGALWIRNVVDYFENDRVDVDFEVKDSSVILTDAKNADDDVTFEVKLDKHGKYCFSMYLTNNWFSDSNTIDLHNIYEFDFISYMGKMISKFLSGEDAPMANIKLNDLKHDPDFEQIVRTQVETETKSLLNTWQADLNMSKSDERRFTHDFDADYFAIMSKINKKMDIDVSGSLNDSFTALIRAIDYNIAEIVDEQNGRLPIENFKVENGVLSCTMVNTKRWGKFAEKALNNDTVSAHFNGDYVIMRDKLDDTDDLRIMLTRDLDGQLHFYMKAGEGAPAEKQEAMDVRTASQLRFMNEAMKLLSVFLGDEEE